MNFIAWNTIDLVILCYCQISAKKGIGIEEVITSVIESIPCPAKKCNPDAPLRALLFDSWFDRYKVSRPTVCIVFLEIHVIY